MRILVWPGMRAGGAASELSVAARSTPPTPNATQTKMITLATAVLSMATTPGPARLPKVAEIPLVDLVQYADGIFIGEVLRVVELERKVIPEPDDFFSWSNRPTVHVAEVDVRRTIKGDPATKRVYYLAQSTWTCDISGAIPGERGVFFLTQSGPLSGETEEFLQRARELTGGAPVLTDAWSGRGRMPFREVDGRDFATFWTDVLMPEGTQTIDGPDPEYGFIQSISVDSLVGLVEAELGARPVPMPAHPESGLPACAARYSVGGGRAEIAFAMWRDGDVIWSQHDDGSGAPYARGRVDAKKIWGLASRKKALSPPDASLDLSVAGVSATTLAVRIFGQYFRLRSSSPPATPREEVDAQFAKEWKRLDRRLRSLVPVDGQQVSDLDLVVR
jgi:hypothetical protein